MSQNKKISIVDFVQSYKKIQSQQAKEKKILDILKSDSYYVPYSEKIAVATTIIKEANCYNNVVSSHFCYNGPQQYILYIKSLLELYTDLEINENFINEGFDLLNENKLIELIIEKMSKDKKEFDIVFSMVRDDAEKNNYNYILTHYSHVD